MDLDGIYDRLDAAGYKYGPTFRGLRSVWRHGGDAFVEVALPDIDGNIGKYGLHPALLDAVLQGMAAAAVDPGIAVDGDRARMPFAWQHVELHAVGATALRARLSPDPYSGGTTITVVDEAGELVMTVGSLTTRPIPAERATAITDRLLGLRWIAAHGQASAVDLEMTVFDSSEAFSAWAAAAHDVPPVVALDLRGATADPREVPRAHRLTHEALAVAQPWLADPRFAHSRLAVLTAGAVSVAGEPIVDVAAAAVWGLLRSAQTEDPERIILADTDIDSVAAPETVLDALGRIVACGEPQVAVRGDVVHVARLTWLSAAIVVDTVPSARLSTGSVVITGGTGGLGALAARHLVLMRGARSLVLASRRGASAPGAADLVAELTGLGARVTVVACDVSSRSGVQTLLAAVPDDAPLAGVVHTAGVLDDGVVSTLTPERLDTVMAAKADAAWWLHEATKDLDLALFV
ncbi:SDR family oxidoreductase, partial [Nocardia sp. NPDC058497]|uniref:SDR family oxidoreductase n=1 Tax=Nocardia sp. NPDC058497 TaxID=3346529 RepID=UPI00364C8C55